jgi:hypothetical protein
MRVSSSSHGSATAFYHATFSLVKETRHGLVSSWWQSSLVTDLRASVHFYYVEEVHSETGVSGDGIFSLARA